MKKSTLILASAILVLIGEAFGQTTKTFHSQDIDYNHYSVERIGDDYILAGTLFDKHTDDKDIHIFRVDAIGNVIWERVINESDDDRALDLCIDDGDNIAVTGYLTLNGNQSLYAVLLDGNGNFITDTRDVLKGENVSAGTNIIYSSRNQEYIVGGYRGANGGFTATPPYVDHGNAIVIRFDAGLGYISHAEFTSTIIDFHGSVNDIVEIQDSPVSDDGYFITGTIGNGGQNNETSVLAVRVDYGLNLMYNASFESSNNDKGVSAVYNDDNQTINVLSNNSSTRKPQVSVIDDNGGALMNSYVLNVSSNVQGATSSAFQMVESVSASGDLVVAGYFDEYLVGATTNNAAPWIVEFTQSGSILNSYVQAVPSNNFPSHGGGILSTFINPHPYIFNQEILSTTLEGGYVLLNPRTINGSYGLQASIFNFLSASKICFNGNEPYTFSVCNQAMAISSYFPEKEFLFYGATVMNYASNVDELCGERSEAGESKLRIKSSKGIEEVNNTSSNIFPNPFNNTITIEILGTDLNGELEVLNAIGEVIYKENLKGEYYKTNLNMEDKTDGVYFIKYNNGDKQEVIKAIKM